MTEKQKKILTMLIEGKNYTEIATELGTSRQDVWKSAQDAVMLRAGFGRVRYYPNLAKYIHKEYRSIKEFANENGLKYCTIQGMLSEGRTPEWKTISKLSQCTGIPIEKLMVRDRDAEQDE